MDNQKIKENEIYFDYDRLAGEIESTVNKNLQIVEKELIEKFNSNLSNFERRVEEQTDSSIKTIVQHFRGLVKDLKKEAINELNNGRTKIIIKKDNSEKEVRVEHLDHPKFEEVTRSLQIFGKVMLVGPAGTGKTYMIEQIAKRLDLPFYKYSCSRDSSVHDLLGYKQPKSEEYLETTFLKAYENGGVFLVDEYDAMSGDMSLFFNGVADNSKFISIPHRDSKPTAIRNENFLLVMCGNTWGKGSIEYSGRDFQDSALMDRFRSCRHYIEYNTELEEHFLGSNYSLFKEFRHSLEQAGSYLSTRNMEDISNLLGNGVQLFEILNMFLLDLDSGEKDEILSKLENFINDLDKSIDFIDDKIIHHLSKEDVETTVFIEGNGESPIIIRIDKESLHPEDICLVQFSSSKGVEVIGNEDVSLFLRNIPNSSLQLRQAFNSKISFPDKRGLLRIQRYKDSLDYEVKLV